MHHRAGGLDAVFEALSWVGTYGLVWIALGLGLAVLRRRPGLLLAVLGADAASQLAASGLKSWVGRLRPALVCPEPKALVHVPHSSSFPSGHAASSFACATVLVLAAPRLAAPLSVLAAAIAFSRVYVGVHYPLDVLAGAAVGVLLGLACSKALRRLGGARRRSRRARRRG